MLSWHLYGDRGKCLQPYFPKLACASSGTSFASLFFPRKTPAASSPWSTHKY